jgi:Cu/Ag efflux protein CusF
MKPFTLLTATAFALTLTACGGVKESAPATIPQTEAPMDIATNEAMDHSGHEMGDGDIGHATGVIKSIGSQGDFLTIDHGPIDGIGMGAMTMGFDIMSDVDLSGFSEGNEVAFMVKKGRDNSYRITAICDTGAVGADCLQGVMDH